MKCWSGWWLAGVVLLFWGTRYTLPQESDNEQPPGCADYKQIQPPPADLPTTTEYKDFSSCNSEELYFGFHRPTDPVKARKCAYVERAQGKTVPETVFGGAGMLALIYANGKGATRNFDLALKFSCETGWAPAEKRGRFEHLLDLQRKNWIGDDFSLCDDATSGFMQGWCADLQERFDEASRARKLERVVKSWGPGERVAFRELHDMAQSFFEASSRNEVDLSGNRSGRLRDRGESQT